MSLTTKVAGYSLKKYLLSRAKDKILAHLFSKFAFLGWGPMGWLTGFIVDNALKRLAEETEELARLMYIEHDLNSDLSDVQDTIDKINEGKEDLTDEEKKRLDEELAKRARDLIKFNRASMPNG